jgi:replicative DNA helicase
MGALDLKDLHLAGDLDVDTDIDPMPLPEMSLAEAEDLLLAVCCSTPKYADHSRVQDAHLSDRGRIILNTVRAVNAQGWGQVTIEHLEGPIAAEIRDRYWEAKPFKQRPKVIPTLDLGTIPKRLRYFDPLTSIGFAEDVLLSAFEKAKYIAIHMKAARIAEMEGTAAAKAWLAERESRLASLTVGVKWKHAADVAGEVTADMHSRISGIDDANAKTTIATNFPEVDRVCCNFDGESSTTIAGWNGHGKSTFGFQLLGQMAVQGTPVRYISAEDKLVLTMKRQLIWLLHDLRVAARVSTNQPYSKDAPDGYVLADIVELERMARRIVEKMPLFMTHLPGCTIEQAEAAVIEAARAGAKVAYFDYLSAIQEPPKVETAKWRNYCFKRLTAAGKSNGLHLIVGAQLKRPGEGAKGEGGGRDETKPPNRYLIEYCPAAEQGSENVLLVHRPQKNNFTTDPQTGRRVPLAVEQASIIVDKAKDGAVGSIDLGWCNARHCFDRRPQDQRQGNLMDKGPRAPGGGQRAEDPPF